MTRVRGRHDNFVLDVAEKHSQSRNEYHDDDDVDDTFIDITGFHPHNCNLHVFVPSKP